MNKSFENTPKVSVLTPLYNTREADLRKTIESILKQTFTDFEFLLLNDSPDNKKLKEIVLSYSDKRIKYFENEHNSGISESRNKLMSLAKGEYLAIVDHDDVSAAERLEKEADFLDKHDDVGVVSANLHYMHGKFYTAHPLDNLTIKQFLPWCCVVAHPACMIRKSVMKRYDIRYEKDFSPCEDYMLWIRLLDKTMFANLPEILLNYRDSEHNTSHIQQAKMQDRDALIKSFAINRFPYLAQTVQSPDFIKNFPLHYSDTDEIKQITPDKPTQKYGRVYKLFNFLPLYRYSQQGGKTVYLFLGLPLWKIRKMANGFTTKYYFLGIPLLKVTKK